MLVIEGGVQLFGKMFRAKLHSPVMEAELSFCGALYIFELHNYHKTIIIVIVTTLMTDMIYCGSVQELMKQKEELTKQRDSHLEELVKVPGD